MPSDLMNLIIREFDELEFYSDKKYIADNDFCRCHKIIKPYKREIRFFEFVVREDAENQFEEWLASRTGNYRLHGNILWRIADKITSIFGWEITFKKIYNFQGKASNWRNEVLLKKRCNKALKDKAIVCPECCGYIPREWL